NNVVLLAGATLRGRAATEPRLTLPVIAFWVVLAVVRVTAMRLRPSVVRWALYSVLVVDIPLFFVMQYRIIHVVAQPLRVAAATLEFGVVLAAALQFFMQPRIIFAATALLLGGLTLFFAYSGALFLFGSALIDLGCVAAMGIYAQSRTRALLTRAVGEATARVRDAEAASREVRALNDELRRQVADRSRELAEALARLAGAPRVSTRFAAGDVVDERYRIARAIGAGGMGQVYEAERLADGRRLALKMLTGVANHEALARFAREAQIAAELDHPGVVAALDVGVTRSGTLFVVMELVAGSSLAASRARYGDAAWALPILRQIAAALSAMHARGIIHRDLKPSNVLVDGDSVKVADFGLATVSRSSSWDDGGAVASTDAALTRTGAVMGTPLYMAPELADGARDVGPSSDIFSFGVVAYELLANRLPHAAPPVLERLSGRSAPAATPLGQARPDLSSELSALVDGCVALSQEQRPSADAVAAALNRLSSDRA
ncbi:MAG: serine/threonine-protein kinase, partial [Polyangia bacterium]